MVSSLIILFMAIITGWKLGDLLITYINSKGDPDWRRIFRGGGCE